MIAITADQIDSTHRGDLVESAIPRLVELGAGRLALPPERTAGDELQLLTADPEAALDLALDLARTGAWSIGLGVGEVALPLPDSTRASSGEALVLAREAVEAAKGRALPLVVRAGAGREPDTPTLQAMVDLLLHLRERRSPEGWELVDLVESGLTQAEAAARLGITPQAASKRAIAAALRLDGAARRGLARLVALADSA